MIKVSEVGVINLRTHNFGLLCKTLLLVVALVGGHGMVLRGAPFDFQGGMEVGIWKFWLQSWLLLLLGFFAFVLFLFTHQIEG